MHKLKIERIAILENRSVKILRISTFYFLFSIAQYRKYIDVYIIGKV